MSCP